MQHVVIVGTGLIGASFGLALRKAGFTGAITGVSSPRAIADAVAAGAIDRGATLAEAVPRSRPRLPLADHRAHSRYHPPPRPAARAPAPWSPTPAAPSARSSIWRVRPSPARQFLGGHPMAGKETRGAAAADPDLFRGRTWILTPDEDEELHTSAALEFRTWLHRIGARVLTLDADEHDRVVSLTSHLAQLASTALAATVSDKLGGPPRLDAAGPGLEDMTRLAMGSYEIWRDILATNSDHIERALSVYIQKLEHMRENLRTRQLQEEFERGAALAAQLRKPRNDMRRV